MSLGLGSACTPSQEMKWPACTKGGEGMGYRSNVEMKGSLCLTPMDMREL